MSENSKAKLLVAGLFVSMLTAATLGIIFRPKPNPDAIGGREYANAAAVLDKKYPITKYLPALVGDCRINYGKSVKTPNDSSTLAIYATCPEDLRDIIRIFFEEKGENIGKYEVIYRDSL
jgi:hypothetical protein